MCTILHEWVFSHAEIYISRAQKFSAVLLTRNCVLLVVVTVFLVIEGVLVECALWNFHTNHRDISRIKMFIGNKEPRRLVPQGI